jgi:hypothetical protein
VCFAFKFLFSTLLNLNFLPVKRQQRLHVRRWVQRCQTPRPASRINFTKWRGSSDTGFVIARVRCRLNAAFRRSARLRPIKNFERTRKKGSTKGAAPLL